MLRIAVLREGWQCLADDDSPACVADPSQVLPEVRATSGNPIFTQLPTPVIAPHNPYMTLLKERESDTSFFTRVRFLYRESSVRLLFG